jgi:hypothetical protein
MRRLAMLRPASERGPDLRRLRMDCHCEPVQCKFIIRALYSLPLTYDRDHG